MPVQVLVIPTATANIASVLAGLSRAGATPSISVDPERLEDARRVVIPGVGALASARRTLEDRGLLDVLTRRVRAGRATLAICLGMQLLSLGSDESPDLPGLGIIEARARPFPPGVRRPHIGWNRVEPDTDCRFLRSGYAYFAHSYALPSPLQGWSVATSEHGHRFVSALEKGEVLACQFHPELSGTWGLQLLRGWINASDTC